MFRHSVDYVDSFVKKTWQPLGPLLKGKLQFFGFQGPTRCHCRSSWNNALSRHIVRLAFHISTQQTALPWEFDVPGAQTLSNVGS